MFRFIEKLRSVGKTETVAPEPALEDPQKLGPTRHFVASLKRQRVFHDASSAIPAPATLAPGSYDLERIPHPLGGTNDWLVIPGTLIGASVEQWLEWRNPDLGDFEIRLQPTTRAPRATTARVIPNRMAFEVTAPGDAQPQSRPSSPPAPVMLDYEITLPTRRPRAQRDVRFGD